MCSISQPYLKHLYFPLCLPAFRKNHEQNIKYWFDSGSKSAKNMLLGRCSTRVEPRINQNASLSIYSSVYVEQNLTGRLQIKVILPVTFFVILGFQVKYGQKQLRNS